MKENQLTKYRKCQCGFYVISEDEFCPNCGKLLVNKSELIIKNFPLEKSLNILWFIYFVLLFVVVFVMPEILSQNLFLIPIIGSGIIFLLNFFTNEKNEKVLKLYLQKIKRNREKISYLTKDEIKIKKKSKLYSQRQEITKNIQLIQKEGMPDKLKTTLNHAEDTLAIIKPQIDFYELQLWEFDLVRYTNSLKPLVGAWDKISNKSQCENLLRAFDNAIERGEVILKKWKNERRTNKIGNRARNERVLWIKNVYINK